MDFVFEVIFEVFIEVYLELMTLFVPENKVKKRKLKMIAAVEAVVLLVAAFIGFCMLAETDGSSTAGKIILITALSVIVFQMVFGLILVRRKRRNKK